MFSGQFAAARWLAPTKNSDETASQAIASDILPLMQDADNIRQHLRARRRRLLKQLEQEAETQQTKHAGNTYVLTTRGIERRDKPPKGAPIKLPYFPRDKHNGNKRRFRYQPLVFTTPNRQQKIAWFCRVVVSPSFSIGCGLTATGAMLAALMVVTGGSALFLPFLLSTGFLFLIALSNWGTIQKRVPETLYALFERRYFKRLFHYSANEYRTWLREYWIDMDDRIAHHRRVLRAYQAKQLAGESLIWVDRKKIAYARHELRKLVERRDSNACPPRDISWLKRAFIIGSLPFQLAGGFMVGILTYHLSIATVLQAAAFITGTTALFATPPGWAVGIGLWLAVITAPVMTGIFIYGSSVFAKIFKPRRKIRHFVTNLFKEVIPNPNGQGNIRTFTRKGVAKGIIKSLIITTFVGLVLAGNFSQMFGGAYILNEFMNPFFSYLIPSMALVVHTPYYVLQAAKFARGWFRNRLDYFRNPLVVIDNNIEHFKRLRTSHSIGAGKANMMIERLKRQREQCIQDEAKAAKKWHFVLGLPVPGKLWVKLPHWVRDILKFQITKTISTVGKGFLSYWGAAHASGFSLPDDGGHVPDAFYTEADQSYNVVVGELSDKPPSRKTRTKPAVDTHPRASLSQRPTTPVHPHAGMHEWHRLTQFYLPTSTDQPVMTHHLSKAIDLGASHVWDCHVN